MTHESRGNKPQARRIIPILLTVLLLCMFFEPAHSTRETANNPLSRSSMRFGILETIPMQLNPTTVYVFTSQGDGFNYNCQGFVWTEMGFVDADGNPAAQGGQQNNDVMLGGNDVGDVLGRDNQQQPNAFRSQDGTREAYDLGRGATFAQAFARLDDQDRLILCAHGTSHTHNDNTAHDGGNIRLDGGRDYTGFGTGTNINTQQENFGNPYPPQQPPARTAFTITIFACWSDQDPDGLGNEISVAQSLRNTLGPVHTVNGFQGLVRAKIQVQLLGGTQQQQQAAWDALRNAAGTAGYRTGAPVNGRPTVSDSDVTAWLSDTPFTQQRTTGQNAINNAQIAAVTLRIRYPTPDPPSTPTDTVQGGGSECSYACSRGQCILGFGGASLDLSPGSLEHVTIFTPHQIDYTKLPQGPGQLNSMVLDIGTTVDFMIPGRLLLPSFTSDTSEVYRLENNRWEKVTGYAVDQSAQGTINVRIGRSGIYAAFTVAATGTVYLVVGVAILALVILLFLARGVRLRNRKR